jgi:hypothetical protein
MSHHLIVGSLARQVSTLVLSNRLSPQRGNGPGRQKRSLRLHSLPGWSKPMPQPARDRQLAVSLPVVTSGTIYLLPVPGQPWPKRQASMISNSPQIFVLPLDPAGRGADTNAPSGTVCSIQFNAKCS